MTLKEKQKFIIQSVLKKRNSSKTNSINNSENQSKMSSGSTSTSASKPTVNKEKVKDNSLMDLENGSVMWQWYVEDMMLSDGNNINYNDSIGVDINNKSNFTHNNNSTNTAREKDIGNTNNGNADTKTTNNSAVGGDHNDATAADGNNNTHTTNINNDTLQFVGDLQLEHAIIESTDIKTRLRNSLPKQVAKLVYIIVVDMNIKNKNDSSVSNPVSPNNPSSNNNSSPSKSSVASPTSNIISSDVSKLSSAVICGSLQCSMRDLLKVHRRVKSLVKPSEKVNAIQNMIQDLVNNNDGSSRGENQNATVSSEETTNMNTTLSQDEELSQIASSLVDIDNGIITKNEQLANWLGFGVGLANRISPS